MYAEQVLFNWAVSSAPEDMQLLAIHTKEREEQGGCDGEEPMF